MRTERAAGFTLVELLVALTIGAMVILLAHALFVEVSSAAARGVVQAQLADREGNRRAWLMRVFANADVGSLPQRGFAGRYLERDGAEVAEMTFQARLLIGERRVARRLHIARDAHHRLVASLQGVERNERTRVDTLILADSIASFGADYLVEYGANARWVREWISPVSAPVAVRLRVTHLDGRADTLLLHIGPRG